MTSKLPQTFLTRPIAHRALHEISAGRPENSHAAVLAAVDAGYGIEIDLQQSADGQAMVFHDYDLKRLTGTGGAIRQRTAAELGQLRLLGGEDGIPTFAKILQLVAGRVPLLVEIKDQDGALGAGVGRLEAAAAQDVQGYDGPIAFMSFNPNSMIALAGAAPNLLRGLTTSDFQADEWSLVPPARRKRLAAIPDLDIIGGCFISHDVDDLKSEAVTAVKARGLPVLCWTIKSAKAEAKARRIADNVTFEGYTA